MKNLKNILALVLTVSCILSAFAISASALSNNVDDILFDWEYYYNANPDVARAFGKNQNALRQHYNSYGKKEGRAPSKLFDPKFYINSYPDLKAAFGSNYTAAYNHFRNNGISEMRQGSAEFSVSVYKQNYADLQKAFGNNTLLYLKHYREYGMKEGRNAKTLIVKASSSSTLTDVTKQFSGKTVTIKSVENGKYLCADGNVSNTPARCNKSSASTWETFTFTNITSDGWVGIKTYNGKYFCADISKTNAPLTATASNFQGWECYRIYQKGNDYYIKSQANGKWLCVRVDTSGAPVQAYASNPSTWERFKIEAKTSSSSSSSVKVSLNVPLYKQNNASWRNVYIGNKTIGAVGCTTTCISMVYSHNSGTSVNPAQMRNMLKYSNNDLVWNSIGDLGLTYTAYSKKLDNSILSTIYKILKSGRPVVIGATTSSGGSQHWVVITGYTGSSTTSFSTANFTVNDPGTANSTTLKAFMANGSSTDRTIVKGIVY